MTSTDTQALIEEAREAAPRKDWAIDATSICDGCTEVKHLVRAFDVDEHNEPWLCADCANNATLYARLADALESSEATRAALDDENLRLREQAGEMAEEIERLRGLVSGDNKELSGRDIYFDNLRMTAGPRVLAVIDKMQANEERTDG